MNVLFRILPVLLLTMFIGCTEETAPPRTVSPIFEAETIDPEVQIGYGLAIGHVNDDSKPDIILADKKAFVWYENGNWERHVMAENLTARDNVAIAARDITGDGLVEVAVGAMWNPGETNDASQSGSVHYLVRPEDPTSTWDPIQLYHEPTVHRMRWVKAGTDAFELVMLPLHGIGNQGGEGAGVNVIAYTMPQDPETEWTTRILDDQMHMTHNFAVQETASGTRLFIAGKEGIRTTDHTGQWSNSAQVITGLNHPAGEVRVGEISGQQVVTTIEPMHGTHLVAYIGDERKRVVLDSTFAQGHALAIADLLNLGRDQIVAGWRNPNHEDKVGIKLYIPDESGSSWTSHIIDDNQMACEDLKVADLNADGKLDIIAAGRASNNLIIYWNRSQ